MKLPDCSPEVLYRIGLALEQGLSPDQMRNCLGDEVVDWLDRAEKDPEFLGAYPPAGADSDESTDQESDSPTPGRVYSTDDPDEINGHVHWVEADKPAPD